VFDHIKKNIIFNKNIFISNKFLNYKNLKIFQLKKLYKIIHLKPQKIKSNFLYTNNTINYNFKFSKLLENKTKFRKKSKYSYLYYKYIKHFFFEKGLIFFNYFKIKKKLLNNFNLFKFNIINKFKFKKKLLNNFLNIKNLKNKFKIKNIYKNKWWFYFLKRMYPYISVQFFDFKLKKLLLKIVKLLRNTNLKNIFIIFFRFIFLNNLTIFNNNKFIIFFKYSKLLKFNYFFNTYKFFYNILKHKTFKNWLKVKFYYNLKFLNMHHSYNMLIVFYINFIFKKYLFLKIFNIYLNFIIYFLHSKFLYLKNNLNYFSNIEIYYDLIKYKDNSKFFIAITPKNLIMTINRRYKKGLKYQKY
jgi:hypothetical protein